MKFIYQNKPSQAQQIVQNILGSNEVKNHSVQFENELMIKEILNKHKKSNN